QCYALDLIRRQLDLIGRPYAEIRVLEQEMKEEMSSPRHRIASLLGPALVKTREAWDRSRALVRCLRAENALLRHLERSPEADPKLADLGLPAGAAEDPYDGAPLRLKKAAAGWVVYAVGLDLKDDGGELANWKDVGLGPVEDGK